MKKTHLQMILLAGAVIIVLLMVLFAGALYIFGRMEYYEDEETATPTEEQVGKCRRMMFLNPSVTIAPLGFQLLPAGKDYSLRFKFRAESDDLAEVFAGQVGGISEFRKGFSFTFLQLKKHPQWWDAEGKDLLGGKVSIPAGRVMYVGAEKIEGGYMIYIEWHKM